MTGVQSAWLTKAQSHSGLVRSSKFLQIVLGTQFLVGQSSRNLWCGSEKPSTIQWCSYTSICLSICSVVKLLGDRVMQNKRFVLILTKLGLRIALEDRTPIISGARTCHELKFFVSCRDTLGKTQCCGSPPCGPTVDRLSSVNSGARYA